MEEELRKEQSEMHKLLKAKQDLIEIQKKRIEYLTNRSSNSNSNGTGKPANQGTTTAATANHLAQSHPSHGYNQHAYQPKLKQNPNGKSQHKPVANSTMTSSHSNPNMLTNTGNEHQQQQQQVSPSSTPQHLPLAKLADKSQIAASPSSSSSSMTQFCSYLAANSLMNSNQNLNSNNNQQTQSKKHDTIKIASPSSSTSSSTSSTLSSIHNNRTGHHNSHHHHNNNNNHPTSANQSASINFLRASEL